MIFSKKNVLYYDYSNQSWPTEIEVALDSQLMNLTIEDGKTRFRFWCPEKTAIVMGIGGKAKKDIHLENCEKKNIPIFRRFSGGGTVLLSKNVINWCCVVHLDTHPELKNISASYGVFSTILTDFLNSKRKAYFTSNDLDICLSSKNPKHPHKKVGGCAQARKKKTVLHHGSIILNDIRDDLKQYLLQPKKQPDYRKDRLHDDFVTDIFSNLQWPKTRLAFTNEFFDFYNDDLIKTTLTQMDLDKATKNGQKRFHPLPIKTLTRS
jgi:lipoate-protein ligase A